MSAFPRAALLPVACAALLAMQPAFSVAQTAPNSADAAQPAAQLDAVVVTASRADTRLADMPLHTTVISQTEIQRSPAQTLDQLLRNVPGLLVSGAPAFTTDPTGHNIRFRGMDKKVLVLVDGIPVLDPFYTTIQWFKVPLSSIERVEIVRGGGSSLWGNLAVGGVINIVSKRPTSNDGEITLGAGSMGTYSASLSKNVVVSDILSVNVSADTFKSDGYNNTPADLRAAFWPGRGNSSATASNLRLSAYLNPAPDLKAFAKVGYHEQNERIGGYDFGNNKQTGLDMQLGLTKLLDKRSRVSASAYAQSIRFDKYNGAGCYAGTPYACGASVSGTGTGATAAQQAAATLQYASSHDLNTYRERGGSLVYSQAFRGLVTDLQLGLDYRAISGEDAQETYRTPTAALPAALRIQRANSGSGSQQFTGLFSQVKLRPVDALELTVGARVDSFSNTDGQATQTNYSNVASPVAAATTGGAVPGLRKTAFDPSLSARYEINEQFTARGSVYKAFRAPGLNNLYRSFGSSSISIANPLLEPETLVAKEVGLDWRTDGAAIGVTLFQADVKDVVATYSLNASTPIPTGVQNICGTTYAGVANAACPGTVSFYTNGQDQRSQGIEVDGHWDVSRDLRVSAYATRTQSYYTRTTTGDPTGVQLSLIPKYVAGASVAWQVSDPWSVFAELRANSSMLLSSLTTTPAIRQGTYAVVNLSTAYKISKEFDVSASVQNAFDRQYSDGSANNAQSISAALPRTFSARLRARF